MQCEIKPFKMLKNIKQYTSLYYLNGGQYDMYKGLWEKPIFQITALAKISLVS